MRKAGALALVAGVAFTALAGADRAARAAPPDESPVGYIEMPASEDGTWVLASPPGSGHNWGKPVFIRYLVMVATEWRRRHPDGPVLRLGDLSKPDASTFPPHKTHKDGLTADVFTTRPANICHVNYEDQHLTLELAQLMFDLGARQILYNGKLVIREIPVAQKWPKHDDHFHVVIDPARVPAEGMLLVLAEPGSRGGDWVGSDRLAEDGTDLELGWRVVGQAALRNAVVEVDDLDDANGVLHTSDPLRRAEPGYRLPIALTDGQRLRWRVTLELRSGETVGLGWQALRVDLQPPAVTVTAPEAEAEVDAPPQLRWTYAKADTPQARYRVEVDKDPDHRRVWTTLGPFESATTSHTLAGVRLRKGRTYHWRVVVTGAHGNEVATDWRRFKTSNRFDGSRHGTVAADTLNLRRGPGTQHRVVTSLSRGTRLQVEAERDGWLQVVAPGPRGKKVRGFVSKKYVTLD